MDRNVSLGRGLPVDIPIRRGLGGGGCFLPQSTYIGRDNKSVSVPKRMDRIEGT
jgi:hypothetical protein